MLNHLATVLAKRAVESEPPTYELPPRTGILVAANILVFLPLFIFMGYTLNEVFPALAMVADENPPAYEPVSLNDDAISFPGEAGALPRKTPDEPPKAVTGSLRGINRVLYANGGFRAYFRGFACLFAINLVSGLFISVLPSFIAILVANLIMIQFSTTWVHIIMTPLSGRHFWQRLPPFKRTFKAAAPAVGLYWLASQIAQLLPIGVAWAIDILPSKLDGQPGHMPKASLDTAAKASLVVFLALVAHLFLVMPAHVTLIRVQASLLPGEEDTIIPFDRSFAGTVEPALVGGNGYATLAVAWKTFTPAAWRRLVLLYVKLFFVNIAILSALAALFVFEGFLVMQHSTVKN